MRAERTAESVVSSPEPDERESPPSSLGELLALAWAFGVAAGAVYAATQLVRQQLLGRIVFVSREVLWMSPLAHVLLFLPVALLLAVVLRRRPVARVVACATFAFLATLSQLLPHGAIAQWAQLVLALGVSVQLTRWYVGHPARTRPFVARAATLATLAIVLVAGTQHLWRTLRRQQDIAALPSVASDAPNVLLIILDTVRGANLSLYGYSRPTTPHLMRRATESAVFDRAFSTAPWTLPSHGSILTGRYPVDLPHDWLRPIAADAPSVAQRFRDSGWLTGGFVANLSYTSYETGLARGFIDYRDYPTSLRLILKHSPLALSRIVQQVARMRSLDDLRRLVTRPSIAPGGHAGWHPVRARSISDGFLAWEARRDGRPFFAFLNYMNAHDPYRAPDSLARRFAAGRTSTDRYDASIARLDAELGRVLDELERRGTLDRTIVVVTSDHGELFGEHSLRGHAHALYLPLLHVPLLVRYPASVPAGTRITRPVSLRDIPATLLDLAGLSAGAIPGASLARTWSPAADGEPSPVFASVVRGSNVSATFPNARASLWSVIDEEYHLIRSEQGAEELYAYEADPQERENRIADPEASDEAQLLRETLARIAHLQ